MYIKPTGIVIVYGHDVEEEEHPRFPVSGLLQFESLFDSISIKRTTTTTVVFSGRSLCCSRYVAVIVIR